LVRTQRAHLGCACRPRVPPATSPPAYPSGEPSSRINRAHGSLPRPPARPRTDPLNAIRSSQSAQANPLKPIRSRRSLQRDPFNPTGLPQIPGV
jgi:hypothetical protein